MTARRSHRSPKPSTTHQETPTVMAPRELSSHSPNPFAAKGSNSARTSAGPASAGPNGARTQGDGIAALFSRLRTKRCAASAAAGLVLGVVGVLPAAASASPVLNLDVHHNQTNFYPGTEAGHVDVTTSTQGSFTADEAQEVAVWASEGKFTLTFGGDTTPPIPFDASATSVQTALRALPSIGSPNVSVDEYHSLYTVTFAGTLANTNVEEISAASVVGSEHLTIDPGEYWFEVANVGDTATSGPITLTIKLPGGISRKSLRENYDYFESKGWSCPGLPGEFTFTCTTSGSIERHQSARDLILAVNVAPGICGASPTCQKNMRATVSGGGSPEAPAAAGCIPGVAACTSEPTPIGTEAAGFGIFPPSFRPDFFAADGQTPVRESGAHPPLFTVPFDFTSINSPADQPGGVEWNPFHKRESGTIRHLTTDLPPGFLGNPTAVGECSDAAFTLSQCPISSQVGRIDLVTDVVGSTGGVAVNYTTTTPRVFNLSHPRGAITDLAFQLYANPIHIKASLDPANRYAIRATVSDINETVPPFNNKLTLWGIPADHSHDSERCSNQGTNIETKNECPTEARLQPFLTVPSQCEEENFFRFSHYDSWQEPGVFGPEVDYAMPGLQTRCDRPRFDPDVEIVPTGKAANSPTGLDVHVKIAQNESPTALATPPVQRLTVTLPEGMSFSPSFADGLKSCSEEQFGISDQGVPNAEPVNCPDASRIGEVSLHTPLLPKSAEGSMYLAAQDANPFHSTFALYLALHDTEERGTLIKIPGKIEVNETTGQIVTVFENTPQFPFDDLTLKFRSGPRAPLINPPTCGTQTIGVEVASYAQPDLPVDASNTYQITEGPNGTPCPPDSAHRPFAPRFSGGSLNPVAGSYSTFLFRLARTDDEQELSQVNTFLPPGLLAKIAGIPFCSDEALESISTATGAGRAQEEHPACPPASQIGTVSAGLGAGPGPNYFPGRVYLAGPYKGAPLSLAIVAPGLAGPFDLGNVVVRVALRVDPETSRVTAVSDPFPTILHGVILRVRDVRLRLDRPETTLNPTNCTPTTLDAAITGVGGDLLSTADDSLFDAHARFQAVSCARLPFKPKIFFKLKGGTHRGDHPAFFSRVKARPGDANFAKAIVALPKSEFLENAHIGTVCTRVQFRADTCPAASIYGHAKAVTPLLDDPVEGDLVLRSSDHPLPDLVARLRGQISANLVGRIDSVNGGIRSSFESVPDVPVSEFTLTMLGGDKGLLVNSRNLCKAPARADVKFTSQSNKFLRLRPAMQTSCKGKKARRKRGALR
jgi:hypothetical protein